MTFMAKKKKFRFQVNLEIEELSNVPIVNGILFCKIRQLDGGHFTEYSARQEVRNHVVRWRARYSFQTKMVASATTGVLEQCALRVSVRKEVKGGKSYQKLGYADLDLAEYAGCGETSRRALLEGYDAKRRQDNSILKINLCLTLLAGDPLFKVPESKSGLTVRVEEAQLQPENKGLGEQEDPSGTSVVSNGSSGSGSLPRKQSDEDKSSQSDLRHNVLVSAAGAVHQNPVQHSTTQHGSNALLLSKGGAVQENTSPSTTLQHSPDASQGTGSSQARGHARTDSVHSELSRGSGYSSAHSTASSLAGEARANYNRTASAGSLDSPVTRVLPHHHHRHPLQACSSIEKRVDSTRISADDLVNQLIAQTNFDDEESAEGSGLQLYVGRDGTAMLGGQQARTELDAAHFKRVIISDKR